ncbi:hypothetical protein [Streptomyces sp. NRRL S-495]|uniref:hypothetical protein n=1 Tax=Streptomyces sp. NRRL S-495 TaxID=1609133 RepID=UPI0005F8DAE6|nr:hypothetical protein [Streptomyces sp. NRRL S-495]KJY34136.1 hypothetical protein VR45_17840 [Streptomyces sp. NRRL S-495]
MANNQNETTEPIKATAPAEEAAAVAASEVVEGAVAATSNAGEFTEPTAEDRAKLENEIHGDDSEFIVEPTAPADGEPGKHREPQGVIWSAP